jgi:hypothetical protein
LLGPTTLDIYKSVTKNLMENKYKKMVDDFKKILLGIEPEEKKESTEKKETVKAEDSKTETKPESKSETKTDEKKEVKTEEKKLDDTPKAEDSKPEDSKSTDVQSQVDELQSTVGDIQTRLQKIEGMLMESVRALEKHSKMIELIADLPDGEPLEKKESGSNESKETEITRQEKRLSKIASLSTK